MNIVYVHQHFTTDKGNVGNRSYDFARMLVERGHHVVLITGIGRECDLGPGECKGLITRRTIDGIQLRIINVVYDSKQGFWRRILTFLVFMVLATFEVLRERQADVVFATSTPLTVGLPGSVARYVNRVPFVFEVRDIWPETVVSLGLLKNPLLVALATAAERAFYHAAGRIIVISHRMGERLATRLGRAAAKLRVIPLGTDCASFDAAEANAAWRREHALDGKFVAVYAGAHGRVNALPWVLKAAALLKGDARVRIVLIGRGAFKPQLIEQARQARLDNVLLLDPVSKESLAGILKACDLGLMTLDNLPIFDTACPNKFMDYLAAGLPVLVNFNGEAGWICKEEGCGVIVPPENAEAMADAIRNLAAHADRAHEMGRKARRVAAERFDRRRLVEDLERTLCEAARPSRPAGRSRHRVNGSVL